MILIIDNYDSFTFNVASAFAQLGQKFLVKRNDAISLSEIKEIKPYAIVISPGPGRPENAGLSCEVVKAFSGEIPILGICLGHQAICHALGGKVIRAIEPVHGKTWEIFHDNKTLYQGLSNPFLATRYHSLVTCEKNLPQTLESSAFTLEGEIMGIRSKELKLEGVQFHPESMGTKNGQQIFANFLNTYVSQIPKISNVKATYEKSLCPNTAI